MENIGSIVKQELYSEVLSDTSCVPFISGAIRGNGEISFTREGFEVSFTHEDKEFIDLVKNALERKGLTELSCDTSNINDKTVYNLCISAKQSKGILEKACIVKNQYDLVREIPNSLFVCQEDRRAFLRGLYLSCGVLRVPEDIDRWEQKKTKSGYLLSFNLNSDMVKEDVIDIICEEASLEKSCVLLRERGNGVFIKNSEAICNVLTAIGSNRGVLRLYDVMTVRKMKNDLNRVQNFDMANIDRTVKSASRQISAIKELEKKVGLHNLPKNLADTCKIRLENEEAGLEELALLLDPPVTKSCINHRMRRIMELANKA